MRILHNRAAASFPHTFQAGAVRDAARIVGEVHDELVRRQNDGSAGAGAAEIYLVIYDVQRFRDLRKAEDDFSFSRTEEKPSPGKQLFSEEQGKLEKFRPYSLPDTAWLARLHQ